jgi:hypothetical protein
VTRGQGWDDRGTFEAIDIGESVQLNLVYPSGATVIAMPSFASSPRKLRLSSTSPARAP